MAGGRSWTPFSDEDKSLILSMYESGARIRSIASKVSIECSENDKMLANAVRYIERHKL